MLPNWFISHCPCQFPKVNGMYKFFIFVENLVYIVLTEYAGIYSFSVLILTLLARWGSCLYGEYNNEANNLVDWPMLWYNATERIILNVPGERDV